MPTDRPKSFTLRRSCQACARGKRRCDQRSPKCSRCLGRGLDCEYINAPLTATQTRRQSIERTQRNINSALQRGTAPVCQRTSIRPPLKLEIAKEYDQSVVRFLVNGIRDLPRSFAENKKTLFVQPRVYGPTLPVSIRESLHLCKIHMQAEQANRSRELTPLLRMKLREYIRHLSHALKFEDLLGYSQALILTQCILALSENGPDEYTEATSDMLEWVAERLWYQAPTQLPSSLSPRHAWLLAESVRRTIIVSLMLRSAHSLNTRNYSTRTPFVDALPFDVRTHLWDDESAQTWSDFDAGSNHAMISLHEYSDSLESARVYDVSPFSALILAACKGKEISAIPFPPSDSYIET